MVQINQNELLEILMNWNEPTFVHIVTETEPTMTKTGNPYLGVKKLMRGTYFIGGTYEDMVITRMKKEGIRGTFKSEKCSVGEHVTKCVQFNEKLNRYYLQYFSFPSSKIKSKFIFEGNEIEKTLLEGYLKKRSETSRQPQENKHDVKSFMLKNIKFITLNKVKYQVVE
jgi:hypothetical protein